MFLRPRPNTLKIYLDIIFLAVLTAIQYIFNYEILSGYLYVNLLTPWLIIGFVYQPLSYSTLLVFLASVLLETHSTIPMGLCFCLYWLSLNLIFFFRDSLSWVHFKTWIIAILSTELLLTAFEVFVMVVAASGRGLSLVLILSCLSRVALTTLIGIVFVKAFVFTSPFKTKN